VEDVSSHLNRCFRLRLVADVLPRRHEEVFLAELIAHTRLHFITRVNLHSGTLPRGRRGTNLRLLYIVCCLRFRIVVLNGVQTGLYFLSQHKLQNPFFIFFK